MKLRVEDSQSRADSLYVRVALLDDETDPENPTMVFTEDFVFSAKESPEQCATAIQQRFNARYQDVQNVARLAESFPAGKELPVISGAQARNILGV